MKKLIVLLISSLFIVACNDNDNGGNTPQATSIVGTWTLLHQAVQCTETLTFNADNTFSATALDEVVDGTYTFITQANASNRHSFSFTITSDNEQFDCEGDNANDVGLVVDVFAGFPGTGEMNWYLQATGGTAELTFNKQ